MVRPSKRPEKEWEIGNIFKMVEMIKKVDPQDPHYDLKVSNLLKGFEHFIKGDENQAALWRTQYFTKVEEFREFFKNRSSHLATARDWFSKKTDFFRLRHFYQNFWDNAPQECEVSDSPGGDYAKECRCWEIKEAYKD